MLCVFFGILDQLEKFYFSVYVTETWEISPQTTTTITDIHLKVQEEQLTKSGISQGPCDGKLPAPYAQDNEIQYATCYF